MEITTKTNLIASLRDSQQRAGAWFAEIPADQFFARAGEVWSASDNLDHLIRSHKPLVKALKLPKITLRAMFGSPDQPSRRYEAMCDVYRAKLAQGGVAGGSYLPDQQSPANVEDAKSDLLNRFSKAAAELASIVETWNDDELDGYLLPHPLLGKLTIREMLFFTIYHNLRHASREGD